MSHGCDCHTTYGPRPKDHVAEAKMRLAMRNAAKSKAFKNFVDHFNASAISQERVSLLKLDFLKTSNQQELPVRSPHALLFPEIGKVFRQSNGTCDFHFSIKDEKIIIRKRKEDGSYIDHVSHPIMALTLTLEEKEADGQKCFDIHASVDSQYENKASLNSASL